MSEAVVRAAVERVHALNRNRVKVVVAGGLLATVAFSLGSTFGSFFVLLAVVRPVIDLWASRRDLREQSVWLAALERGEALADWTVSPMAGERARRLGTMPLMKQVSSTAGSAAQVGGMLVLLGYKRNSHLEIGIGVGLLASSLGWFAARRVILTPPRDNEPVHVLVGPACAVVGRDIYVWASTRVRLARVEVDETLPHPSLRLHIQEGTAAYDIRPGQLEIPFEPQHAELARATAARLVPSEQLLG